MNDINKQLDVLAILWCDWNEGIITGNDVMAKLWDIFPEIPWEWRARMKARKNRKVKK